MEAANILCGDGSFGPGVQSADCRDGFDFTVLFEETILAILPTALFLLLTPIRALSLFRRKIYVKRDALYVSKLITIGTYTGLQLALVVLWTNPAVRSNISIASSVLSFVSGLALGLLSHLEHAKSIRPSFLISFYLIVTVFFDIARVRTQWLLGADDAVAGTLSASLALKCVMLLLEAVEKRSLLLGLNRHFSTESTSSLFSRGFFWWLNSLLLSGYKTILTLENLPSISEKLDSGKLTEELYTSWSTCNQKRPNALIMATTWAFRWEVAATVIPKLCYVGLSITRPFLIQSAILFVQNTSTTASLNNGYGLLGAFALVYVGLALTFGWASHLSYRIMAMMRGGLVGLIYRTVSELDTTEAGESSALTLMGTDVSRIAETYYMLLIDALPSALQIGIAVYLLYIQLGLVCLAPIGVTIVATFFSLLLAGKISSRQKAWLQFTQRRINFTSQTLGSMRNIKMLGLTEDMSNRVQTMRDKEIGISTSFRRVGAMNIALVDCPDGIARILVFAVYAASASAGGNGSFSVAQAITALSTLSLLIQPLYTLMVGISIGWTAVSCFHRIQDFLVKEGRRDKRSFSTAVSSTEDDDLPQQDGTELQASKRSSITERISIENGNFGWAASAQPIVKDATTHIKGNPSLTVLIGPVGCGKSTFLKAILGETPLMEGVVKVFSSEVAYCDQTPWILNGSIRDNIVGENELESEWYNSVVAACDLETDLQNLPERDATVVGSKGIKLSGGQKQRISIARAVYARKRLAVLDDVLSGLDSATEEVVFRRVFGPEGLFRRTQTTVLLATHSVKRLAQSDYIIALNDKGQLVEQGTFLELNTPGTYVNSLNIKLQERDSDPEEPTESVPENNQISKPAAEVRGQVADESRKTGDFAVYKYYLKALSLQRVLIFLVLIAVDQACIGLQSIWLNWWAQANESGDRRLGYWLGIYAMFGIMQLTTFSLAIISLWLLIVPRSCSHLHKSALVAAMRAPISFFAVTETGVLVNRFSQDLRLVDMALPGAIFNCTAQAGSCLVVLALSITAVGYFAVVLPPLFLVLYLIQRFYLKTSRQIRLLEIEANAPLFSHFIESLSGLTTIRAFGWTEQYMAKNKRLLDKSQKPYYLLFCVQRWLVLVLDLVVAGLAVLLVGMAIALREKLDAGFLGLALVSMMNLSIPLTSLVQYWTVLETSLGAIARLKDFSENTPIEALPEENANPDPDWPSKGSLKFEEVCASYQVGGPPVLKSVSFTIEDGMKIGIVGRTGSGKSSTVSTILRMTNLISGKVLIDDVDISTLTGAAIRERLICLTQDPFLFTATIRENIDPLSQSSDEAIVKALEKVEIWDVLKDKADSGDKADILGAQMDVDMLSHGQRQLFCLGRALLKPGKILILDEPTSSVDSKTDAKMQEIIRSEFKDHTVIMIAHRLSSLVDFDRIAVLDSGELVEFGSPKGLIANKASHFYKLYEKSVATKGKD